MESVSTTQAKAWLSRAKHIDDEISILVAERDAAFERATSITAHVSDSPRGGSSDYHKFDSLVALDEKIDMRVDELTRIKAETIDVINLVENETFRRILFRRYISGKTWEKIADEMNYSTMHIQRLHGSALLDVAHVLSHEPMCCGMLWSECSML